jgi:thioredoxin reductase (NADPH)
VASELYEIAIVGAGPAGLSAALYSARFCRSTLVLHDGKPRAARIPKTYNAPGFNDGVAGADLVDRMTCHAAQFGASLVQAHIDRAERVDDVFVLHGAGREWRARALIVATGLNLNQIPIDADTHQQAIDMGVLRYCPVCDGFEHQGKRIAVVGCDVSGAAEALFLRQFSGQVTLLPKDEAELTAQERRDLAAAGIATVVKPIGHYLPTARGMQVYLEGVADPLMFDVLYPALGVAPRSELIAMLGLKRTACDKAPAEAPFGTIIPGLYCAGDVVDGLDQISVAMGHGAIAATRAHNWLRESDGKTVETVLGDA